MLLVCVLALAPASPAEALAGAGSIGVRPNFVNIIVGQSTTVEIWVEEVEDYYGLEVKLRFDPARVSVPAGACAPLWDVFDEQHHLIVRNSADNQTGQVWYAISNLNPAGPFSGSGRICSLTFVGLANGPAQIEITFAQAANRDGESLWPRVKPAGAVWVGPLRQVHLPMVG